MFVRNKTKVDFKYRKGEKCIILKAGTVTLVEDGVVSARELLSCYGQRIEVIGQNSKPVAFKTTPVAFKTTPVKKEEELSAPTSLKGIKNEETFIDDLLAEVNAELGEVADTGNKEVDDFLNGETDVLPEGTEEITDEEVLELLDSLEDTVPTEDTADVTTPTEPTDDVTPKAIRTRKPRGRKSTKKQ